MATESENKKQKPKAGEEIVVLGTRIKVLSEPTWRVHRDAAFWAFRYEFLEGERISHTGWLGADQKDGPWEPVAGFA